MAFKFLHQLLQQAQARRKPQPHEIQMLGALLVRYPEVDTAEYEPKYEQLRVNFMVRAELTQTELEGYDELLAESFRSYRHLAGQEALPHVEITAEVLEKLTNVHVTWFIRELSVEALDLLTDLAAQYFGDALLVDQLMDANLEADFIDQQEEIFTMLLAEARQHPPAQALAGYRDGGHIIVYNR